MRSQCAAHSIRGLWRGGLFCTLTFLLFQCTLISAIADEDMVRAGEKMAPSEVLLQRAAQPRTHVVIGALAWKDEHSLFLESLRDCGHQLSFSNYYSSASALPSLFQDGVPFYDNVILASVDSHSRALDLSFQQRLRDFVKTYRGNIFILGAKPSGPVAAIASHLGIQIQRTQPVRDFFHNIHNVPTSVLTDGIALSGTLMSEGLAASNVLYQGRGLTLDKTNALLFPLLYGRPTSYGGAVSGGIFLSGSETVLIAGFQARHNARIALTESGQLCSDATISLHKPNLQFCKEVVEWVTQQRGVVDWFGLKHYTGSETSQKEMYQILEPLTFSINASELGKSETPSSSSNTSSMVWKGLSPQVSSHLQLEFTMLNPYWRLFFQKDLIDHGVKDSGDSTRLRVSFKCPDQYGIFKGVIKFVVKGYSFLHIETLTPVRNFKHDDYERFIWSATPYYASTFISALLVTAAASFLLFGKSAVHH